MNQNRLETVRDHIRSLNASRPTGSGRYIETTT